MNDPYEMFKIDHRYPWCWWCGRSEYDAPEGWFGPFLVERAHIVNKPRVQDVRAVVLLCSLCHRAQHGAIVKNALPQCMEGHMIWMKRVFDARVHDMEFLQQHSVGRLARTCKPPQAVHDHYLGMGRRYPCDS